MKKNAAVFLDRDGTINEEVGYLDSIDKLKLFANTAEAIRLINESGMKAVVITNQSGVAKGYFTEEFVRTVHERIQEMLRERGAFIDAFYYCPHHQTEGIGVYLQSCACRKPEAGMLIEASKELDIDLRRSYTVGDMLKDIQVATCGGSERNSCQDRLWYKYHRERLNVRFFRNLSAELYRRRYSRCR